MTGQNGHERLGLPPQAAHRDLEQETDASEEDAAREKVTQTRQMEPPRDTHLGIPSSLPEAVEPLSDTDRRALEKRRERLERQKEAEAERRLEEELAESRHFVRVPDFIFHPTVVLFLIVAAGLFALFAIAQTASTLASLQALPPALQYVAWGSLLVILGAVIYAALRLGFSYLRLRKNRQVPLPGLRELARRTELHQAVRKKQWEATNRLKDYLRDYPLDNRRTGSFLRNCGLDDDGMRELVAWKERLLESDGFVDSESWLHDFRHSFQSQLDRAAARRRAWCARRTAVKTAVSPNPLIDSLISLYYGYTLISDLCRIYRLRSGGIGTALILGHVFINAYLAGKADESEEITESFVESLFGAGGKLAAEVSSKVVSKGAAGAFNYLLMHRLGKTATNLLRPVQT